MLNNTEVLVLTETRESNVKQTGKWIMSPANHWLLLMAEFTSSVIHRRQEEGADYGKSTFSPR